MNKWWTAALVAVFAVMGLLGTASAQSAGTPAPDFSLVDLDGNKHSLADFRGQTVLLDFWATWCGPCRQLMQQHLAPLHNTYDGKGLTIIGISNEDVATQKKFADAHNYHWLKLIDASGQAMRAYGVRGIPHLVLIDGNGKILTAGNGFQLMPEIRAHLAGTTTLDPPPVAAYTPESPAGDSNMGSLVGLIFIVVVIVIGVVMNRTKSAPTPAIPPPGHIPPHVPPTAGHYPPQAPPPSAPPSTPFAPRR